MSNEKEVLAIGTEVMLKFNPMYRESEKFAFKKTKIIDVSVLQCATQYRLAIDEGEHIWDSELVENCTCNNCVYENSSVSLSPCKECLLHDAYIGWVSKQRPQKEEEVKLKACITCKFFHQCSSENPCKKCDEYSAWENVQDTTTAADTNPQSLDQQHYSNCVGEQPIEVMLNKMSPEEFIGFLKGNILKYTLRMGKKEGEPVKKEARKILQYAKWLEQFTNTKTITLI